jgi:hypothetical protein
MEDKEFREKTIELKKREEQEISKQCTNIFKNSQEFILTLISQELTPSRQRDVMNELLLEAGKKFESIV